MQGEVNWKSHRILFINTLAFTVCFAVWMLNGVLVTFLTEQGVFDWGPVQIGWLIGIPVLTGALFRLPAGMLTDKYGGKPVFTALLLLCAIPLFLLSQANSFLSFALCSFGFGLVGSSFAIGIAYTSVWYPKHWQGRALGIFGAGNAGAAITTMLAPSLLRRFTEDGTNMEGWRTLPLLYAGVMVIIGILFLLLTTNKKPPSTNKTLRTLLQPLKWVRVWRFGLYYFLVFGCFVAFAQWLVPYFVNMYYMPLITAGLIASAFSFPSGIIRILGGWMSDKWGGRVVMYWVLGLSVLVSALLIFPRMEVLSPGEGILAKRGGVVEMVTDSMIVVGDEIYHLDSRRKVFDFETSDETNLVFPTKDSWHNPAVAIGQQVEKKELLAKGMTRIYFQANIWIAAFLIILIGIVWGIGKAAVYKFIPEYYPDEVGVVGGIVGVIGGLGGFFCPIIFGYLLKFTGFWTSCWIFMFIISLVCLLWMQKVVSRMAQDKAAMKI